MEKEQKKVLIIIGVILVSIAIITLIISAFIKDEEPDIKPPEENIPSHKMNREISLLKNEKNVLTIQNILNNYLELLNGGDMAIIKLLDEDFLDANGIYNDNVILKLKTFHNINFTVTDSIDKHLDAINSAYFIPKKVFSNTNSETIYYFIDGYIDADSIVNSKFLVIVNNGKYVIKPLDSSISDIEGYANNYDIIYREIDNDNKFGVYSSISEENKISLYLNEFKNMLYKNPKRAYDMLYEPISTYDVFLTNKEELYDKLSIRVLEKGKQVLDDYTLYTIYDYNNNRINIYEYSIFNFKIEYELNVY